MDERPVVVQLVASSEVCGGPLRGLDLLMTSDLRHEFDFRVVAMPWAPHGISVRLLVEWARLIRRERPALVHVRGLQSEGLYGVVAAHLAGCDKTVLSVHGFYGDLVQLGGFKRLLFRRLIEPLTLHLADVVYCVCRYAENRPVVQKCSRDLRPAILNAAPTYNLSEREARRGVARTRLGIPGDAIVVVSVGRLTYEKGYDLLVGAMRDVLLKESRIHLLIVGDGPYREHMQTLANDARVHLVGSQPEVMDYYLAADIFVTASRHENLSNALLEACAAGLAIVATNVGGNPEVIVHEDTGTLVAPNNEGALVEAVLRYAHDDGRRLTHGRAAQLRARSVFSQATTFARIGSVYREMLRQI